MKVYWFEWECSVMLIIVYVDVDVVEYLLDYSFCWDDCQNYYCDYH